MTAATGPSPSQQSAADDAALRDLLKTLLPRGMEISPLSLEQELPPQPADLPFPDGLEVDVRTVKVYGIRQPQQVPTVRLHTLSAFVPIDTAFRTVRKLQKALGPRGYQALVTATAHGYELETIYSIGNAEAKQRFGGQALIVCFQAPTPLPLLYARGTNGVNVGRGIHTHHIATRLHAWSAECDYTLLGAGSDWLQMHFRTFPKDIPRFAGELYLLCPWDRDSAAPLPKKLFDLPFEQQQPLAAEIARAFAVRTAADLDDVFRPNKELFLWWD